MTDQEAEARLRESGLGEAGWTIVEAVPGEKALSRSLTFKNFRTALALTSAIGAQAEEQKHHPRLTTEWGAVRVEWWTHSIGGLHENDFVMAAKTEELAKDAEGIKPSK
ncbi:putative pterin-4-alpha-carbinolamine dehydratase [Jaminaea rosea]|uniref:4a-hydroxytetrahydrobiopterin dehydratase n=1 Tax=Jaminaea rosea TaxID=1569628 RepID=A0A316US65_9BASI|nr:putative pterin-4-alpha-carbinolamine dehydratase [Jaminaea rosea]PWN28127.1 putative pterin-4-alpha-carbinolamine dehydratase [Jaminaea rosea]